MSETLRIDRSHGVVVVTLDRVARRNALDAGLWDALRDTAHALASESPRAVIYTGAEGHFCAGMDLSPENTLFHRLAPLISAGDREGIAGLIGELKRTFEAIASIPAPILMAIEGACHGGGLEMALAGDLRIAGEGARFSMPETQFGMVPDVGGTVRLAKLVGQSRATDLILTGRRLDAPQALGWGLVNEVVPTGTALERAKAIAERIARASPSATREALLALRSVGGLGDTERFARETEAGVAALQSAEVFEGVAAFVQKRSPSW